MNNTRGEGKHAGSEKPRGHKEEHRNKKKGGGGGGGGGGGKRTHLAMLMQALRKDRELTSVIPDFICTVFILITHKITYNINNGYGTIGGEKRKACIKNRAQALRSYTKGCTKKKRLVVHPLHGRLLMLSSHHTRVYT